MDDRELRKLAEEIVKALKSADRQVGVQASGSKAAPSRDKIQIDTKTTNKSLKELNKTLSDVAGDLNNQTKLLGMSRKELIAWQDKLFEGLVNNEKLSNKAQDKLKKKIENSIKSQSKFAHMTTELGGDMKSLGKIMKETGDFMDHYNDILETTGETAIDNIQSMEDLKKSVDALAKTSKYQKTINDMIAKQGSEGYRQSAKILDQELKEKSILRNEITTTATKFGKSAGIIDKFGSTTKEVGKGILSGVGMGGLAAGFGIAGLIAFIFNGIQQTAEDYMKVASFGLVKGGPLQTGMEVIHLTNSLAALGLTIDDFTEIVKKNYVTFARLGASRFIAAGTLNQKGIMQMGESTKDAFAGSIAMAGSAQKAGVDMKNRVALNNVMAEQLKAFKLLKIATGESSEEFAKNNNAIMQSAEYEALAAGMGKKRRSNLMMDMLKARIGLAKIGIQSSELQSSILKQMQAQQNGKVVDRFKMGADLTQAGSFLGMGAQTSELRNILLKGGNASQAENSRKVEILTGLNQNAKEGKMAAAAAGDFGRENIYDAILDKLGPLLTDADKANNEKNNPNTLQGSGLIKRLGQMQVPMDNINAIMELTKVKILLKNPFAAILEALNNIYKAISEFSFEKWFYGPKGAAKPIPTSTIVNTKNVAANMAANVANNASQGLSKAQLQAKIAEDTTKRDQLNKFLSLGMADSDVNNKKQIQDQVDKLNANILSYNNALKVVPVAPAPTGVVAATPSPKTVTKAATNPAVVPKTAAPTVTTTKTATVNGKTSSTSTIKSVAAPVNTQPTITKEQKIRNDIEKEKEKTLKDANAVISDKKDITKMTDTELLQKILLVLEAEYIIQSDGYQLNRRNGLFKDSEQLGFAGSQLQNT